jgi:UDP-GlcNAc:undecaprenyl-phosphate/decaprenyl-phosphate GlcNAc-1-phosphate transferase
LSAEARIAAALALSLGAGLVATPMAIRAAVRIGFYDRPAGYKGHAAPTPYLGGAAVVAGFLVGALGIAGDLPRLAPIFVCALFLFAVGTLDDRVGLGVAPRVAAEAATGVALFVAGLGWHVLGSGAADLALTVAWVVGIVNAFNLMDNMDGAAGTVAVLSSIGAAVLALSVGDHAVAALSIALGGACLGFLPFNLSAPARIFLGDGGSMPIGFILSAAIMAVPLGGVAGWHRLLVAALLVAPVVVDTTLVTVSRRRAGVAVASGGRDHITHRLRKRFPSARAVALVLATGHATACVVALVVADLGDAGTAVAWVLLMVSVAGLVTLFETRAWAPPREPAVVAAAPAAAAAHAAWRVPRPIAPLEIGVLLLLAVGCGVSPLFFSYYDLSVWGPIGFGMLALLLGLVLSRPVIPRPAALVAIGSLVLLWAWSLISTGWSGSPDRGAADAGRWLLYAATLGVFVLLLRDDRLSRLLLGVFTAMIAAFGVYLLVRILTGDARPLFLANRLHGPLGYVNGEAGYLLLGFWPLVAAAERARRAHWSALAVAAATMLLGLVLLSETRAVIPALVVGVVVLLAAVPGRRRRAWILVVAGAAVIVAAGPLTDVYRHTPVGQLPSTHRTRTAAEWAALAALFAGVGWWAAFILRRLIGRSAAAVSSVGLAGVACVAAVLIAVAVPHPFHRISDQWRAFTQLRTPSATSSARFFSGGGNRYDYWRIAWHEFRAHPWKGVGAGSYDSDYFRMRRTAEDVTQPHSVELQSLAELGVVGGLGILSLAAAVLFGLRRRFRGARPSAMDAGLAVAAGGIFLTWFVHTSVDWLHLLPGVTGVALGAAAVLVGPSRTAAPVPVPAGRRRPAVGRRTIALAGIAVVISMGAVFLARTVVADRYASDARSGLPGHPVQALADASRSLRLQESAITRYTQAAAYARLNDYARARGTLLGVARRQPTNFVVWGLLGDLAVRRGDLREAKRDYGRAHALNPRDAQIAALARTPSSP